MVRVFDNDAGLVAVRFLAMCLCTSGTATTYFKKLESVFKQIITLAQLYSLLNRQCICGHLE